MITNFDQANERCSFVMSESDDSDILADIEALDEALALTVKKKSPQYDNGQKFNIADCEDFENNEDNEDTEDYLNYLNTNRHIDESLNAYEINTRLITGLTIAKNKFTALLEECEAKLKLLDEKMTEFNDQSNPTSKLAISNAGMPYFKDKDYYSAPKNYDTKLKEAHGELFVPFLKKPSRWTGHDRITLLSAINDEAIESVLSGDFNKKVDASTSKNETRKTQLVLPRNFNEMVGPLGTREFDWHKISVMDFDNKHSPGECRAMWNVYLHPDFRKNEWTNAEDNKLLRCVRAYKNQDWDAITLKLGTNRSAYQCFIRYNTIKKMPSAGCPWTRQEDKHLVKILNTLRIGDYIPWSEVANHMRHRTKQQIYVRWNYRKAPHLKKGRFTSAETSTLMKAVQKYGKNFTRIANIVMPQRTSIQLQERYQTVMANKNSNNTNLWTLNDDMTLINLYRKYYNDWAKIATRFRNKSRTQVRHRYSALLKYIRKGISLERIPRQPAHKNKKDLINKTSSSGMVKLGNKRNLMQNNTVQISDIQSRLYETLCFPPSVKCNNSESEEIYDVEHLVYNTKKLYSILNLLNANLDIPDDSISYIQLNNRERQLLISLKEHINILRNNGIPMNNELIENFRIRMFGYDSKVSKSDFFIPPLPFDGYVRTKKSQKNMSEHIDYDIDFNEKFLADLPTEFSVTSCVLSFLNIEEEIQFHKFGQFLTNHNYNQQNIDLYKSMRCIFSFAKQSTTNKASLENNELNVNSNASLPESLNEQLNKETNSIFADEDEDISNIILPNQATLLGLKNLFLWKLLYDCQDESRDESCESMASTENKQSAEQTTTNSLSVRTESAEYQLLRTRLLKLFKIPIGLSNIILRIDGPEMLFSSEEPTKNLNSITLSTVSKKRKLDDTELVQLNKKNNSSNISANSDSQLNSGVTMQILPTVAAECLSPKKYKKKYKRIAK